MKFEPGPWMTTGTSILLLGAAWLLFWPGPAFHLYDADPRWAHNFAFALIFVIVGIASFRPSVSTGVISLVASFIQYLPTCALVGDRGNAHGGCTAGGNHDGRGRGVEAGAATRRCRPEDRVMAGGPLPGTLLYRHRPHAPHLLHGAVDRCRSVSRPPPGGARILDDRLQRNGSLSHAVCDRRAVREGEPGVRIQRAGYYWAVPMLIVPLASIGIVGQ